MFFQGFGRGKYLVEGCIKLPLRVSLWAAGV